MQRDIGEMISISMHTDFINVYSFTNHFQITFDQLYSKWIQKR